MRPGFARLVHLAIGAAQTGLLAFQDGDTDECNGDDIVKISYAESLVKVRSVTTSRVETARLNFLDRFLSCAVSMAVFAKNFKAAKQTGPDALFSESMAADLRTMHAHSRAMREWADGTRHELFEIMGQNWHSVGSP